MLNPILPGVPQVGMKRVVYGIAFFALRPGICFVLLGVAGLIGSCWKPRSLLMVVPLLCLLILFMFDPHKSHLTWLPWFNFARLNDRFSSLFPLLLSAFALALPWDAWKPRVMKGMLVLGLGLFVAEFATAYAFLARMPHRLIEASPSFRAFMQTVSQTPGEAVMEWPFRVCGGNGGGRRELGVFVRQHGAMVLQPFHRKKMMGSTFGRLYPSQIQPLLSAGWQHLMLPDSSTRDAKQRRDFTAEEWAFLEEFYRRNDFCGIIIYPDRLPEETVRGFHGRFGSPAAYTEIKQAGRLEFIPKPAAWRKEVDPQAGLALIFEPQPPKLHDRESIQFTRASEGIGRALVAGWCTGPRESWTIEKHAVLEFRWAGPTDRPLVLEFDGVAFGGQQFTLLCNGARLRDVRGFCRAAGPLRVTVPASLVRPRNRIDFDLPNALSARELGRGQDHWQLGVRLKSMKAYCLNR
jgi:hypothetical protein